MSAELPFADFAGSPAARSPLREAITAACRRPEPECLPPLLELASVPPKSAVAIATLAKKIVTTIRASNNGRGIDALMMEYSLSSAEGISLMCLAEALLRIPDNATRDALIRDKVGQGNWQSHFGGNRSLFVNAATWALILTGKLSVPSDEDGLSQTLTRLVARGGEPLIRQGVNTAMKLLGDHFVSGQNIDEAIAKGRAMEAKGFRYSYDMLGEAATTAEDAERYLKDYENAIHAIGKSSANTGIYNGPGISIKLSALHPRYERAQRERVMVELLPRLHHLAQLARRYDIGLNIDAEEADRLELSLDLLEVLAFDGRLSRWNGLGFVVQAYGKRSPFIIDYLIDLARRSQRRLMVRLVKGAYWDSEIKAAQVEGLEDYPVFTRKVHTDVCYEACARKLLAAPEEIFPQFATHNAQTVAYVMETAGESYQPGQYEFQCLHGMGEPLYEEIVGPEKFDRPCRIYAPVGSHDTLLAYLVRRLLENGANSSFVNQLADPKVSTERLIADPIETAREIQPVGAPHPGIALPRNIFGEERKNSRGLDLSDEAVLAELDAALKASLATEWLAAPISASGKIDGPRQPVRNPADHRDSVGEVITCTPHDVDMIATSSDETSWSAMNPAQRAEILQRAADLMEGRMEHLIGLIIREAGKSTGNAISEIREAVDFLRYYAAQVGDWTQTAPLGTVVCISPWNFPLSIFVGQVAAALAAGNAVIAKPAEETPLIAAAGISILHEAGVPLAALQFAPGDGEVGAALVAHDKTAGVMFTGSTEVAKLIQQQLANRLGPDGRPIPLIAETGGQNAMIVDSSALAEQVVADALTSAFDSAGQRCSALRILCLQNDIADRTLAMLKGGLAELRLGNPDRLATDVGPVITAEARETILAHIEKMRAAGCPVTQLPLPLEAELGTFVPPTIIEVKSVAVLNREVFGPVLHVVRYARQDLDKLIGQINALGYGLTFGLHTRIDETVRRVTETIEAGNIYVNRNIIGAVVGVQPFGGHGLSGTGPKAGGPLYVRRLLRRQPPATRANLPEPNAAAEALLAWLETEGRSELERCRAYFVVAPALGEVELRGPVGERNSYSLHPRGAILVQPRTEMGALIQLSAVLATGNSALIDRSTPLLQFLKSLPSDTQRKIRFGLDAVFAPEVKGALAEGPSGEILALAKSLAERDGPLVTLQGALSVGLLDGSEDYNLEMLVKERLVSINTAAAGGNASLMTLE
ncbi:MAG: putA [Hyphomicrobiales bacterium]|nr:putA [Hyphomicrobiales bacterium]